jgi:non-heme chloroperoxidase
MAIVAAIVTIVVATRSTDPPSALEADRQNGARASATRALTHVDVTRVSLSTGIDIDVAHAGDITGTPVLFLHGYTDSWVSFGPLLEQLPPGLRAVVPSQRGHGDSERPDCCYGMHDFAADAVALLDALRIERAVIVGHSMGSFIAQRIAIDHADRVSHLVLIGSGHSPRAEALVEFAGALRTWQEPIDLELIREFQASSAFEPLPTTFLDTVVAESSKVPLRVWQAALTGLLDDDASAELDRITTPALVVWGEQDGLWPRPEQDALVRAIRGARLLAYPATGHAPHWEQPASFAADLTTFLERR